jgi:hypothetical protein
MSEELEFHLKGEDNRALLVSLEKDGGIHLSVHMRGGHAYMTMTREQSKLLFEAMSALKEAQEGL